MLAALGARMSSADAVANKGGNEALCLPLQAGNSVRRTRVWEGAESKVEAEKSASRWRHACSKAWQAQSHRTGTL
jgi:hypothetical protein